MFGITQDPSSGSLVQCLAKNYKNDSIVSVDMDKALSAVIYSELHTRATGQNIPPLHRPCPCQRTQLNHSSNF